MRPDPKDSEKLLLLTLTMEAAVQDENWREVNEIVRARAELIETLSDVPEETLARISTVEERMLTLLRRRLVGVRADMRNLSAALRIANSHNRTRDTRSSLSLAG